MSTTQPFENEITRLIAQDAEKVKGFIPPEGGSLPEHGQAILASAYAACRKEQNGSTSDADKEKCSRIAWGAVKNAGYHKNSEGNWVKGGDALTRKIGFDRAKLEPKIIAEDDTTFTMHAIIAREMVQPYGKLRMLKAADELEKAYRNVHKLKVRSVTLGDHPATKIVMRNADVKGFMTNFSFAKDLKDPKTHRPMDSGISADVTFYKDSMSQVQQDELKQGLKPDVSIGFTYDDDMSPGEWRGQKYDGVQRNIFIDHLAAGIDTGRCPSPFCGLGLDSISASPVGETVMEMVAMVDEAKCPVCRRILDVGLETAGSRLYARYGADILDVIEGNPLPAVDAAPETPREPVVPATPAAPTTEPAPSVTVTQEPVAPTQTSDDLILQAQEAIDKSRSLLKHLT